MGVAVAEDGEVGVARAPADSFALAPAPAVADTSMGATSSDGEVRTETTPA